MESENNIELKRLEEDYTEVMKGFQRNYLPFIQMPQWTNPNDFIVKFSLYQETPNSITSTDTLAYLGV